MKNLFLYLILSLAGVLAFPSVQWAQTADKAKPAAPPMDLQGVWNANMPGASFSGYGFSADVPSMTPLGMQRYLAAKPSYGPRAVAASTDYVNPTTGTDVGCLPPGVPRMYIQPFPFEIIQTAARVVELFEFDHNWREIFTDGRKHIEDPDPSWMGDSIGHYEGDTLIIDTVGFNDKTWIDRSGLPASDQLHVIERIRRPNPGALEIKMTIDDPKMYTKPWEGYRNYKLQPTWNLKEFVCLDNADYNKEFIQGQGVNDPTKK